MKTTVAVFLGLLALGATTSAAQEATRFRIVPVVGLMRFDKTSGLNALDGGKYWASGGLSAAYAVTEGFRAGLYLEYQRPTTSPDFYPYALFRTGSNFELFGVSQVVGILSYGVDVAYQLPSRWGPYVKAGIGRHAVYGDVQVNNSTAHVEGTQFVVGGGLNYAATGSIALRLELVDFMWNDWDRDLLNPVDPAFQNTTFPEDNPAGITYSKPSLIHNMRLGLGVSFTPSGGAPR
jgi:opacity protein-like surface antigen